MNVTHQAMTDDIDPGSWYSTVHTRAAVRWPWGWMFTSVLATCAVFLLR